MKQVLLDLVYPRVCAACGKMAGRGMRYLCWECLSGLHIVSDPICSICGDPADGLIEHQYKCSWCVDKRPFFERARSAVRYRDKTKEILQRYKYNNEVHLTHDFVSMLSACVQTHYSKTDFDAVIYVPLDYRKQRQRTYNQSQLLAKGLAQVIKVPCVDNCLKRVRNVESQTRANAGVRKKNVRNAFEVMRADWIYGRNFLLVDDIMTTGATVNECSRVLAKAGAVTICVVTVARG